MSRGCGMAEQKRRKKYPFSVTLSAWILGTATAVFAVCALISGNGAEAAEHPVWQPLLKAHDRLSLMLGSNRVKDLTPLQNLGAMESLYLSDNLIEDIRPL